MTFLELEKPTTQISLSRALLYVGIHMYILSQMASPLTPSTSRQLLETKHMGWVTVLVHAHAPSIVSQYNSMW